MSGMMEKVMAFKGLKIDINRVKQEFVDIVHKLAADNKVKPETLCAIVMIEMRPIKKGFKSIPKPRGVVYVMSLNGSFEMYKVELKDVTQYDIKIPFVVDYPISSSFYDIFNQEIISSGKNFQVDQIQCMITTPFEEEEESYRLDMVIADAASGKKIRDFDLMEMFGEVHNQVIDGEDLKNMRDELDQEK